MRKRLTIITCSLFITIAISLVSGRVRADVPAQIIQERVNLRKIPSASATTISTLELDTEVFIIKERDNWCYVFVPIIGEKGWVLTKALKKLESLSFTGYSPTLPSKADYSSSGNGGNADNEISQDSINTSKSRNSSSNSESDESVKSKDKKSPDGKDTAPVPVLSPETAKEFSPEHPPIALISGNEVNLRAEPNLKSEVIATLEKGCKVYLVGISGPWYHVSVPFLEKRGFVFGSFVSQLHEVEITADNVNLREEPSLNAPVITTLSQGERFVKKGELSGWYWVVSPKTGFEGWVNALYAKVSPPRLPKYKVVGDVVNFRATPNVDADIITQLSLGEEVKVLGREPKWSLVEYSGKQGWVYSEYLVPTEDFQLSAGRDIGRKLAKRGLDLRGIPYRWGGDSVSGFDCSGFVYFLLREQFGLKNLPRRASEQYYEMGSPVDKEDLRVGDLVFFTTYKPGPSHVGVYIGDGNFVHASSAGGEVQVNTMSEGYYKRRFFGARRITEKDLEKYNGNHGD